jgi:HK97 gp10 family phage protein
MKDSVAFITGVKELDAKMRELPRKAQMKYGRKALRTAARLVLEDYKRRVPVDTGSMRDAIRARATKRKRGQTGMRLTIDRDRVFELREERSRKPSPRALEDEAFFYPAIVELGDGSHPGKRPLTKALYDSEQRIRSVFVRELERLITDNGT